MTFQFKIVGKHGNTIPYKDVLTVSSQNTIVEDKVIIAFESVKNLDFLFKNTPDEKVVLFLTQEMLILSFIEEDQYYLFSLEKEVVEKLENDKEVYFSIMKENSNKFEVNYIVHYNNMKIL